MKFLLKFANFLDLIIRAIGRGVSWLVFAAVMVTFSVVVMRYGFEFGRIWVQESYLWMHAVIFMLGAAWTLQDEGHVRVDILYRKFSDRGRCWVDLLGVAFLLIPTCVLIFWISAPYAMKSWHLLEGSRETGGIPAVFLLKTVIPLMAVFMLLQGLSMLIHNIARLRGLEAFPETISDHACVSGEGS